MPKLRSAYSVEGREVVSVQLLLSLPVRLQSYLRYFSYGCQSGIIHPFICAGYPGTAAQTGLFNDH